MRLPANHVIPLVGELKGKKYCKFHNATNHNTNECRIFRLHIQKAIEQGKIKFELGKKPAMDIDGHPFSKGAYGRIPVGQGKDKGLDISKGQRIWLS